MRGCQARTKVGKGRAESKWIEGHKTGVTVPSEPSTSNLHCSKTHWALVRPRRIVGRLRHPAASRAKPYTVASHMHRSADVESLKVGDKIVDLAHARLVVLVQDGLDRLAPNTSSGIHRALEHPPATCFLPGLFCRRRDPVDEESPEEPVFRGKANESYPLPHGIGREAGFAVCSTGRGEPVVKVPVPDGDPVLESGSYVVQLPRDPEEVLLLEDHVMECCFV